MLCPRYIRQGQPYRFLVSLFQLSRPVVVTAIVHRDGVEIAKIEREVATEGVPELITLTVSFLYYLFFFNSMIIITIDSTTTKYYHGDDLKANVPAEQLNATKCMFLN